MRIAGDKEQRIFMSPKLRGSGRKKGAFVECQLRMYTLKPDALSEFVEEWAEKVVPLRERYA